MKLILGIYDHGVIMHVNFCEDFISFKEVLPFDCLNINEFVHSKP